VASYGSDNMANVTLTVEVSTNGLEWTSVETLAGAADITGTMTERVIETIPENAVYLRFVATAQATSNKRINIDNIAISLGQVVGKPVVVIDGNLSGTVNSQMSLEITLQNAIAADWWFDLKDPDNQPDNSYAWDAGTGVFSFTPSKVGNYTLTAEAVDAGDTPSPARPLPSLFRRQRMSPSRRSSLCRAGSPLSSRKATRWRMCTGRIRSWRVMTSRGYC